ncbi:BON domain-containing protein [Paracidovorax wautersii]|uniref:Hyperosmotically inducible protein n=1 Tax=Paracidovorax wautersii TaxID=1177982 RepID=A0ABU1IEW5_9BURK|nr:BON domain-containing protein [Paracidovorax wautersii]MDR6215761.1 hyperosmotically inducible protein [Paracidovorax wautersii]
MEGSPQTQQRPASRVIGMMAVLALAGGLVACDKNDGQTAGQRLDSAVQKTEQTAADAQRKMETAADRAGSATRDAAAKALAVMDDAGITTKVNAGLAQDPDLSAVKIDVDTRNGIVTLNGPVKSAEARERAGKIAQGVEGVNSVVNQLTVSAG